MVVPSTSRADADPHTGTGWLHEMFSGHDLQIGWWDDTDPPAGPKDRMTDVLTAEAGIGAGQHLLDVAGGRGGPAVRLARRTAAAVTGLIEDRADRAAAQAWAAANAVTDLVDFRPADPVDLPFADGFFDAAWAIESGLPGGSRGPAVLGGIRRVLRPSGVLVVADYVRSATLRPAQRELLAAGFGVTALPAAGELRNVLIRAGFEVRKEIDATGHMRRSARRSAELVRAGHERIAERAGSGFADLFQEQVAGVVSLKVEALGYVVLTATRDGR